MKYSVQFEEVNIVTVEVQATTEEEAEKIVREELEEGLDYDSPRVSVDYSHTNDSFNIFQF